MLTKEDLQQALKAEREETRKIVKEEVGAVNLTQKNVLSKVGDECCYHCGIGPT
jgi:hypothetical protein